MKIVLFLIMVVLSYGSEIEILAKHFEYNQTSQLSKFTGDVNVTRGKDNILSNKLYIYMNKKKKLSKLIAIGNVRFLLHDKNNSIYKGTSEKLTYIAVKELFIFEGKVHIMEIGEQNKTKQVFGDKIILDKKNGTSIVDSKTHKPLKILIKE